MENEIQVKSLLRRKRRDLETETEHCK